MKAVEKCCSTLAHRDAHCVGTQAKRTRAQRARAHSRVGGENVRAEERQKEKRDTRAVAGTSRKCKSRAGEGPNRRGEGKGGRGRGTKKKTDKASVQEPQVTATTTVPWHTCTEDGRRVPPPPSGGSRALADPSTADGRRGGRRGGKRRGGGQRRDRKGGEKEEMGQSRVGSARAEPGMARSTGNWGKKGDKDREWTVRRGPPCRSLRPGQQQTNAWRTGTQDGWGCLTPTSSGHQSSSRSRRGSHGEGWKKKKKYESGRAEERQGRGTKRKTEGGTRRECKS